MTGVAVRRGTAAAVRRGMAAAEAVAALATRLGSAAEARWMVEHVVGRDRPSGTVLDERQCRALTALAEARSAGEPLQYLLGTWSFRRLELAVDPRALIPRPETEQVVEVALAELRRRAAGGGGGPGVPRAVDLGTGTGAIALSLAVELDPDHPGVEVWATDVDPDALALATENRAAVAARFPAAGGVRLAGGSWFDPLPEELRGLLDLVVANPPYVSAAEWGALQPEVRHEPRRALVAGSGSDGTPGLAAVEAVLAGARGWLAPRGVAVVELAPHQAAPAARGARRLGYAGVRVEPDLAGRPRALVARA